MAGRLMTARAEIDLAVGDTPAAAAAASEAISMRKVREAEVRRPLPGGSGRRSPRDGPSPEAVIELRRAVTGAERLANPPTVWRTLSLLGHALSAQGDDDGAAKAFGRAQEIIKGFAATLSDTWWPLPWPPHPSLRSSPAAADAPVR